MKTEKLYYIDAYMADFDAEVISCVACERGFDALLDRTAFFPEGGGQRADTGMLDEARLLAVLEIDGAIHHYLDKPLEVGRRVNGRIDFSIRFDKMQQHSAEHLAIGILHKLYGAENTGFHLGPDEVTFDTDIVLSSEMLERAELMANRAIYENRPITQSFPKEEELSALSYRSKLDLGEGVRIVNIEGYDSCACCAPHLSSTAEIGLLKFVFSERHKGGTRVYMAAGERAYKYFASLYKSSVGISQSLSVLVSDIEEEVRKLNEAKRALEYALCEKGRAMARVYADMFSETDDTRVIYLRELQPTELREFVNLVGDKARGILVALCGEEGNYKFVIRSPHLDVKEFIKDANLALCGRGGGRGATAEGSFCSAIAEIRNFFEKL